MITSFISRIVIMGLGTLYPAYASYKAIKTKDMKEYVKWMMYWVVFALFTSIECFADIFLAFWFPFYYELKIMMVLWLLSPFTKGASIMYRSVVHPLLTSREQDIDAYIANGIDQGYRTIITICSNALSSLTNVIMTTAVKHTGLSSTYHSTIVTASGAATSTASSDYKYYSSSSQDAFSAASTSSSSRLLTSQTMDNNMTDEEPEYHRSSNKRGRRTQQKRSGSNSRNKSTSRSRGPTTRSGRNKNK